MSKDKNFGPVVLGQMLGAIAGGYQQYGVTKKEFVRMARDVYDGVERASAQVGLNPGWGAASDVNIKRALDRLRSMVANDQLPEERVEALWHLIGQVEDEINKIREGI